MASPRRNRGALERDVRAVLEAGQGPMTPAQVRSALGGKLAYTTVMTVLARLHAKGEVDRQPSGRGYAYAAPRDSTEVTAQRMQRLLDADVDRAGVLVRFVGRLDAADEHLLRSLLETTAASEPGETGGSGEAGAAQEPGNAGGPEDPRDRDRDPYLNSDPDSHRGPGSGSGSGSRFRSEPREPRDRRGPRGQGGPA
jgi:predicted transcriptional regulator